MSLIAMIKWYSQLFTNFSYFWIIIIHHNNVVVFFEFYKFLFFVNFIFFSCISFLHNKKIVWNIVF